MTLTPAEFAAKLKTPCSTQLIREYCRKNLIQSTRKAIKGGFEYRIPESQISVFEELTKKKRRGWPLGKKREGHKNLTKPQDQFEDLRAELYSANMSLHDGLEVLAEMKNLPNDVRQSLHKTLNVAVLNVDLVLKKVQEYSHAKDG